jgi:hypothetical protein
LKILGEALVRFLMKDIQHNDDDHDSDNDNETDDDGD